MRYLADTHAVVWWLSGDVRLPRRVRDAMTDQANEIVVSAASAWEIATKFRLGKLPEAAILVPDVEGALTRQGFSSLPITMPHAQRAGGFQDPHRDPFDRLLIAQSLAENLILISNERIFDRFGVHRLW